MGEAATEEAFRLTTQLRREGYAVQCDLMGRSVKAQMKYANKIGALYSMVLGDSELQKRLRPAEADGHRYRQARLSPALPPGI